MTEMRDEGGPAFPLSVAVGPNGDGYSSADISGTSAGMSLRDWFAGQALNGIAVSEIPTNAHIEYMARTSYLLADAMLEARK